MTDNNKKKKKPEKLIILVDFQSVELETVTSISITLKEPKPDQMD